MQNYLISIPLQSKEQEGSIAEYAPCTPPMVPALLVHCVNEIERRGLTERGLYRLSGADKDVKRLKVGGSSIIDICFFNIFNIKR